MRRSRFRRSIASLVLAFVSLGLASTGLRLVTHLRRRWGNDVVHGGTDISLILHLDSGSGWLLTSQRLDKVIHIMRALIRKN